MNKEAEKSNPFISIIMAVYNNEKYFPTAVNSILNQSFPDFELIIVDDGSTDNTPKIADEFAEKDNRIKVIHQENQWVFASYNNGIAAAQGEYLMIVNSDDTINPDSLKEIKKEVDLNNPDLILYNMDLFYCDENQIIISHSTQNRKKHIDKRFYLNNATDIHKNWSNFLTNELVNAQCVYKSSIAKKNFFRNDVYMADTFYNLQIADQITSIAGVPYTVYNHFTYDTFSNASGKYYDYSHDMFNELFLSYKKLFQSWELSDKHFDSLYSMRMRKLTSEFNKCVSKTCQYSNEEKTFKIFFESIDDVVYECGIASGRKEELEARILSALRELFLEFTPEENTDARMVYDMLESLLRYEKDESDLEKIKKCVYHEKNKYNIGESFLKKLLR